jgi:IclR family transcriptional regulator, acetate operon repressor
LQLAFSYYDRLDEVWRIRPTLAALAQHFDGTAHYAVLLGADVMYVGKMQVASGRVQTGTGVGGRLPAHSTGVGKALLAYRLPDRRHVEGYIATYGPLERRTRRTLVEAEKLNADLVATRRRGYAIDREETRRGSTASRSPCS